MKTSIKQSKFNYGNVCLGLLETLPERQKIVLSHRFGLAGQEPTTLQQIGDDFGITRERVRQIEREGLNKLSQRQQDKQIREILDFLVDYLASQGGVKREDLLLRELASNGSEHNSLYFLLELGESFHRIGEDNNVYSFWSLDKSVLDKAMAILKKLQVIFEKEQKPLPLNHVLTVVEGEPVSFLNSVLEIAKKIEQGPLGHYGLVEWPEIKPRGVKDMAFLALTKQGSPLHFREIAKVANELNPDSTFQAKKKVLPQTLHNELIRDSRFVLVGRGIYALKNWGYNNGTVKEIISSLVSAVDGGLTKEEILNGVLAQRLVRDNTILLNLHNKKNFIRDSNGRYTLKS